MPFNLWIEIEEVDASGDPVSPLLAPVMPDKIAILETLDEATAMQFSIVSTLAPWSAVTSEARPRTPDNIVDFTQYRELKAHKEP